MVLMTSFSDHGPPDLRQKTTVFPTSVARRLRSLQPPSPTTVLLTSVAIKRSFRPPSHADYGSYDLLLRPWLFRPQSPNNDLSDLHRSLITVHLTSSAEKGLFDLHRPLTTVITTSFVNYGHYDLLCRLRSFRPPSLNNGLSDLHHPATKTGPLDRSSRSDGTGLREQRWKGPPPVHVGRKPQKPYSRFGRIVDKDGTIST
ncbi:hypothetical protein M5K25_014350 [Dendrobium thyrsiflorum]|uniref:Uncharacterized protein n=1 Tax=Dendrobium thyrsiflorum TaxID=117978 RepID=A0ABD0UVJ8_DENTH